jgi:hypothetical protein
MPFNRFQMDESKLGLVSRARIGQDSPFEWQIMRRKLPYARSDSPFAHSASSPHLSTSFALALPNFLFLHLGKDRCEPLSWEVVHDLPLSRLILEKQCRSCLRAAA